MSTQPHVCSQPDFGVIVERNVMVPLRDGVRLATDLYFPAREGERAGEDERVEGQFPAVMIRTPYDKLAGEETGKYYARRGYVAAMQDVRGRYASEGEFYPFAHEGPDGYDAVEWLAAQPWCTGKVRTFGQSYCAADQSALACLRPPPVSRRRPRAGPRARCPAAPGHRCLRRTAGRCTSSAPCSRGPRSPAQRAG